MFSFALILGSEVAADMKWAGLGTACIQDNAQSTKVGDTRRQCIDLDGCMSSIASLTEMMGLQFFHEKTRPQSGLVNVLCTVSGITGKYV